MSTNNKRSSPPKYAERLLGWFCKGELLEEILGDLYEYYQELLEVPAWKRNVIYWFHVFHFLRPSLVRNLSGTQQLNYYGMFKLYIRAALRNALKHKIVSFISLFTLVVGALSFHLVYAWINNEMKMDKFHSKGNRIHLAMFKFNPTGDFIHVAPSAFFRTVDYTQLPEVENVLVVHAYDDQQIKLKKADKSFPGRAWVVDSTFFDFFDFKIKSGSKEALNDPQKIVITEEFAQRLFPDENPLGKEIEVSCDQKGLYQIGAVLENIPATSSIDIDFLVPRHSKDFWRRLPTELLLVGDNFDREAFNSKFAAMGRFSERHTESVMSTLPFNTLYFDRQIDIPLFKKQGDLTNLRSMQLIVFIILIVTVLSFTNLQTTVQLTMAKKIATKRVMGASRFNLGFEIGVNALLYFCLSLPISFIIYELTFPYYVQWMELDLDQNPVFDLQVLALLIGFIILVSMTASAFRIVRVNIVEGLVSKTNLFSVPITQRVLTTLQYGLAIMLMISTSVIFLQLKFMLNKDTGLQQKNIMETNIFEIFPAFRQDSVKRMEMLNLHSRIVEQLNENPDIVAVSQGTVPINDFYTQSIKRSDSDNDFELLNVMSVDSHYDEVFGLDVIDGFFFSDSLEYDNTGVVINESAMRHFNIDRIDGVELVFKISERYEKYAVIGVVKDFHFQHLSHKVSPLILRNFSRPDQRFIVRHKPGARGHVIDFLDKLYREVNNDAAFTFENFEDRINAQYANEKRMANIVEGFAVVTLLLATSGLFTFVFHETKRRIKEIGIRKINGASQVQLIFVLSRSFLLTILIAFLISAPIAWYLMQVWLEGFASRIDLSAGIFISVGLLSVLFALVTISWHTLKAARANPVDSLASS